MEFKSLTNIESSFKRIRFMLIAFVCCCTLITGYALWNLRDGIRDRIISVTGIDYCQEKNLPLILQRYRRILW